MELEILFRGKRVDNGEWVYGYYWRIQDGDIYNHYILVDDRVMMEKHEVIPETVGQYTGLLDKHGTKIFEDDIVKLMIPRGITTDYGFFKQIGQVFYADGCYFVGGKNVPLRCKREYVEVMGNIHDNPELLEVSEC